MATIKSYTSLEQSKVLVKILPIESADMYYTPPLIKGHTGYLPHLKRKIPIDWDIEQAIPCWSLASLLEHFFIPLLTKNPDGWQLSCLTIKGHKPMIVEGCADPIEACYKMIVKLHEMKML